MVSALFANCGLTIRTLLYLLQLSGAEVGILFSAALNDPLAKVFSFLDTCAGQAGGAYVQLNI